MKSLRKILSTCIASAAFVVTTNALAGLPTSVRLSPTIAVIPTSLVAASGAGLSRDVMRPSFAANGESPFRAAAAEMPRPVVTQTGYPVENKPILTNFQYAAVPEIDTGRLTFDLAGRHSADDDTIPVENYVAAEPATPSGGNVSALDPSPDARQTPQPVPPTAVPAPTLDMQTRAKTARATLWQMISSHLDVDSVEIVWRNGTPVLVVSGYAPSNTPEQIDGIAIDAVRSQPGAPLHESAPAPGSLAAQVERVN
jgi:hypothetical protein